MTARQRKELDRVYTRVQLALYRALRQCSEEQKLEILTKGMAVYLARSPRQLQITDEEIRSYIRSNSAKTA